MELAEGWESKMAVRAAVQQVSATDCRESTAALPLVRILPCLSMDSCIGCCYTGVYGFSLQ